MQASDMADVERIGDAVHQAFPERTAVPAERLALFPDGCLIAGDATGAVIGYAVTHPWHLDRPVPLDTLLGGLPANSDCLYIHDVALRPAARGTGLGRAVVTILAGVAERHGLRAMALTAVHGSVPFWTTCGFAVVESPALAAKLASYGPDARYMVARL